MRIAVLVVHTPALFRYLLDSIFALRRCLIIRLYSGLTVHDTLGSFGGFGLSIYISWQNAVYFAREFRGKLESNVELDIGARWMIGAYLFPELVHAPLR